MSNDHVSIRCESCGKEQLIATHWQGDEFRTGYFGDTDAFIAEHLEHHPKKFDICLQGNPGFSFHTDETERKEIPPENKDFVMEDEAVKMDKAGLFIERKETIQ